MIPIYYNNAYKELSQYDVLSSVCTRQEGVAD